MAAATPAGATVPASASSGAAAAPVRWGIVSCGKISHDFVNAIKHLSDVSLVACAARSLSDAEAFAKRFGIARAYGSYAELVADPEVQVCYIGSLHPQHSELSTLCLEGGKHVLCEKPFAVTARQAEAVVALAQRKNLFVMEAMWSRFVPSIVRVREILASGVLGDVKVVSAPFGFRMSPDTPRLWENAHAGGATLDLGVYPIALASMVFSAGGTVDPSRITAAGELSEGERIDTQLSITLQYGPGQMAVLHCSMLATLPNEAYIIGTKGWVRLDAQTHWHATQRLTLHVEGQAEDQVLSFPEPARADQLAFNFVDSQLMVHECREVNRCVRAGLTEAPAHSTREAVAIARIMDEVRRQVGVVYAQDKKQ